MITLNFANGFSVATEKDKEGYLAISVGDTGAETRTYTSPEDLLQYLVHVSTRHQSVAFLEDCPTTISLRK